MTGHGHDPALCDLPGCGRCDAYGDGYAAGKAKAHDDLRGWQLGDHAAACGCDPCSTIRQLVRHIIHVD